MASLAIMPINAVERDERDKNILYKKYYNFNNMDVMHTHHYATKIQSCWRRFRCKTAYILILNKLPEVTNFIRNHNHILQPSARNQYYIESYCDLCCHDIYGPSWTCHYCDFDLCESCYSLMKSIIEPI